MPICRATKRNGEPCRVTVEPGVDLCWAHDGHVDVPVAGELLGGGDGLLDAVDEGERCGVGVFPVRRRLVGDDEDVLAYGRLAVLDNRAQQALVLLRIP